MSLEIKPSVAKQLPSSVRNALGKMPGEQQSVFEEEYSRKRRNVALYGILAIFSIVFPVHFFMEGRPGQAIVFWLTGGGLGIWWLIEIFTVWGRTGRHNEDAAISILRDMKIMNSGNSNPTVIIDQRMTG
ncbi:TM2 domain-containing protein [Paradevosia shaoguanensis]|uniref:TM2 domain-containing protein n=1 Tax=Paradevosia shaoguanensis TaxID=1335043 RepID=UPI0019318000|nr:TM2 domain-containing protein [Paradevosia shaoguanensis]